MNNLQHPSIGVSSETGALKKVLIHSPDRGVGKVIPSKAQDWLFEDIVHLKTIRSGEYDYFVKLLLYFIDPEKVRGKIAEIDRDQHRKFYKPGNQSYFDSDKVMDIERLLAVVLEDRSVRKEFTAALCAVERCSYQTRILLDKFSSAELATIAISGVLPDRKMIFAPLPNLIFTRDVGITINDHFLLSKTSKIARSREALLAQYVFFCHPVFETLRGKIIEVPENEHHFLLPDDHKANGNYLSMLEGGDVMMVAPDHLLIGCSERTTIYAAQSVMQMLFEKNIVKKVTILKIPHKRDYMHIDTIFTQVRKDMWVLLGSLGRLGDERKKAFSGHFDWQLSETEYIGIMQYINDSHTPTRIFDNLEDLLADISKNDLGCEESVKFVYSGNNEFPFGAREQWTDSCNLLALKEGVVVGYDRNDKTLEAFRNHHFEIIGAADLLNQFESGILSPDSLQNTLITLPSAELSRARGGTHCMSLPLLRE